MKTDVDVDNSSGHSLFQESVILCKPCAEVSYSRLLTDLHFAYSLSTRVIEVAYHSPVGQSEYRVSHCTYSIPKEMVPSHALSPATFRPGWSLRVRTGAFDEFSEVRVEVPRNPRVGPLDLAHDGYTIQVSYRKGARDSAQICTLL